VESLVVFVLVMAAAAERLKSPAAKPEDTARVMHSTVRPNIIASPCVELPGRNRLQPPNKDPRPGNDAQKKVAPDLDCGSCRVGDSCCWSHDAEAGV
jgi:hypothetical protein